MTLRNKYLSITYLKNGFRNKKAKAARWLENMLGFKYVAIENYPKVTYNREKLNNNNNLAQKFGQLNPLKLHFGCGPRVIKNWINIDIAFEPFEEYLKYYTDEHYPPSLRGSINDFYAIDIISQGLSLPNESVDVIFHEDFFEHINQRDQVVFLAETLRVMKKGAVHRINTPNIKASMRDNSDFKKGKDGVYVEEWNDWHHLSIMSPAILEDMALMVGYSRVIFNKKNESTIKDDLPVEYRPNFNDRNAADSNVFADLIK